jgi:hypothetical protein
MVPGNNLAWCFSVIKLLVLPVCLNNYLHESHTSMYFWSKVRVTEAQ